MTRFFLARSLFPFHCLGPKRRFPAYNEDVLPDHGGGTGHPAVY